LKIPWHFSWLDISILLSKARLAQKSQPDFSVEPSFSQPPRGRPLSAAVHSPLAAVITKTSTFETSLGNPVISNSN